jgi:hypothetical protein
MSPASETQQIISSAALTSFELSKSTLKSLPTRPSDIAARTLPLSAFIFGGGTINAAILFPLVHAECVLPGLGDLRRL